MRNVALAPRAAKAARPARAERNVGLMKRLKKQSCGSSDTGMYLQQQLCALIGSNTNGCRCYRSSIVFYAPVTPRSAGRSARATAVLHAGLMSFRHYRGGVHINQKHDMLYVYLKLTPLGQRPGKTWIGGN